MKGIFPLTSVGLESHHNSLLRASQIGDLKAGVYLRISVTPWSTRGGWIFIHFMRPYLPFPFNLITVPPVWFQPPLFFSMLYVFFSLVFSEDRWKNIWLALQTVSKPEYVELSNLDILYAGRMSSFEYSCSRDLFKIFKLTLKLSQISGFSGVLSGMDSTAEFDPKFM